MGWVAEFRAARDAEPILTDDEVTGHLGVLEDAQIAFGAWAKAKPGGDEEEDKEDEWQSLRFVLIGNGREIARKADRYRKKQSTAWKRSPAGKQMSDFIECWRDLDDMSDLCEIYTGDLVGPFSSIDPNFN